MAIEAQQYERAAWLLGAAGEARERLNAPSTDQEEIDELAQAMARLEAVMGGEGLERASGEGRLMSLDEAVALALDG